MKSQPTQSKPNHHQQQGQPSQLTWVYSLGGRLRHLTHSGDLESLLTSFLSDNYSLESPDLAYSETYNELERKKGVQNQPEYQNSKLEAPDW